MNTMTKECPRCHRHYPAVDDNITPHRTLLRNKPRGCGYPRVINLVPVTPQPATIPVAKADTSPIGHILTLRLPGQGNATILGRCVGESSTHVEVACNNERPDLGEWFAKKFVL